MVLLLLTLTLMETNWKKVALNAISVTVRLNSGEAFSAYRNAVEEGTTRGWVTPPHVFPSEQEGCVLLWLREKGNFYGLVRKNFPHGIVRKVRPQAGLYVSRVDEHFFHCPVGATPTEVFATRKRGVDGLKETVLGIEPGFFLPCSLEQAEEVIKEMVELRDYCFPGMNLSIVFVPQEGDDFLKFDKWMKQ